MIAQFSGSFIGALIALIITKTGGDLFIENGGGNSSDDTSDSKYWFQSILMETFMTTIYVVVFLCQQRKETCLAGSRDIFLSRLITAITFGVCIVSAQPISGGCLNPAVGLSLCLVNFLEKWKGYTIAWFWIYLIFPFAGAYLGAHMFNSSFSKGTSGVGPGGEEEKGKEIDGGSQAVGGEFINHLLKSFG